MGRQKANRTRHKTKGLTRRAEVKRRARVFVAGWLLPVVFCLAVPPAAARQQKVVDQIVALVNDDIITRSDLIWSLAMDPSSPNPAEGVSSDLLRRKLDVFIDQKLIAQEARRIPATDITPDEVAKHLKDLVARFKSDQAFHERVDAVGLTADRIDALIRERIQIERFVDFRFRSFAFVTDPEISRYYDDELAPRLRSQGQVPPALDATLPRRRPGDKERTVREAITEIIRQRKIDEEIDRFLNAVRQRADINILTEL